MLSSSRDNVSILYSTISGREVLRFENENSISSFCFGSDSELLAYGSNRGLELMNLKSGKVELLVETNNNHIQYIHFLGKEHPIIYVTQDNVLHFIDLVKKKKTEFKLDEKFEKIELNSKCNKAVKIGRASCRERV